MLNVGVVYIAIGAAARAEAQTSIASLRAAGQYIGPIHIIGEKEVASAAGRWSNSSLAGSQCHKEDWQKARIAKTSLNLLSPFAITIFLDTDTIALQPIGDLLELAAAHDLTAALDEWHPTVSTCSHSTAAELLYTANTLPLDFPQYNTGVITFKATGHSSLVTHHFFTLWRKEWRKFQDIDQLAFARALSLCPQSSVLRPLPQAFNRLSLHNQPFDTATTTTIRHCLKRRRARHALTNLERYMFVIFTHAAASATECLLAGEFNNWTGEGMVKGADGNFSLTKTLPPGAHAYRFVVDGVWTDDDGKKTVDGMKNPCVRVPAPSNTGLLKGDWNGTVSAYDKGDITISEGSFWRAKTSIAIQDDASADKPSANLDKWEKIIAVPLLRTKALFVTGHNGAGACTATGLAVGDVVLAVVNLTDVADAKASFEAAATVANQLQQSSATDLSAKKFLVIATSSV